MDFMRIVRSLEEFLYEVMTWLVFYPRTLWRTAIHPVGMLAYARAEFDKPEDDRFGEVVSAPLFLIITLVISHGFEMAVNLHPLAAAGGAAGRALGSDQNLIIGRALAFALFPLMFALGRVRAGGQPLTHETLRGPFFGECYPAAVFCLTFGVGGAILQARPGWALAGGALMALAVLWYLAAQTIWRRRNGRSWGSAVLSSLTWFLAAAISVLILASLAIRALLGFHI